MLGCLDHVKVSQRQARRAHVPTRADQQHLDVAAQPEAHADPAGGDRPSSPTCTPGTATGTYNPCPIASAADGTCCTAVAQDSPVYISATAIVCRTPSLRPAAGGALPLAARVGVSINGQSGLGDVSFRRNDLNQAALVSEERSAERRAEHEIA